MALLAVIDVEDLASEKVAKVKSALDDLVNASAKAQQVGTGQQTQQTKQQTDALQDLMEAQKRSAAQTVAHARAFEVFNQSLKVGSQVTPLQAKAFDQLGTSLLKNKEFAAQFGTQMRTAMNNVAAGVPITNSMAANLKNLQQGFTQVSTGAKSVGSSLSGFKAEAAAAAASFGLIAGGAYALLRTSGDLAARIETMGVVMGIVAKNSKLSSTEMLVQVEAIKKLGITTQESNDAVLQFVQSGLKLADASRIARAAQDLAVIAGENSSQTFQRLTRAIQTNETMLLRQVGIVTTNEMVYREYAKTLNKTWQELTQTERRQAFVNKILEEGKKAAGAYEAAMGTAGKQIGSFNRFLEESRLALGEALLPTMGLVVSVLTALLKVWLELPKPIQAAVTAILAAAAAASLLAASLAAAQFLGIAQGVMQLAAAFKNLWAAMQLISAGGGVLSVLGMVGAAPIILAVVAAIGLAIGAYVAYSSAVRETTNEMHEQVAAAIEQEESFKEVANAAIEAEDKLNKLKAENKDTAAATEEYNKAVEKLLKLAPGTVQILDTKTGAWRILREEIKKTGDELNKITKQELDAMVAYGQKLQREFDAVKQRRLELQKSVGEMERGDVKKTITVGGLAGRRVIDQTAQILREQQAELEVVNQKYKQLNAAVEENNTRVADATRRWAKFNDQQAYARYLAEDARKKLNEYLLTIDKTGKGMEVLTERAKKAGFDITKFTGAKDIDEMNSAIADFDKAWTTYTQKQEQRKKQLEAQIKGIWEAFRGTTVQMEALASTLPQILDIAAKQGGDKYIETLKKYDNQIQELAKNGKLTGAALATITKAAEDLKNVPLDTALAAWNRELQDMERNLQKAISDNQRRAMDEARQNQITQGRERIELQEEINERIYDANVDMFERTHVARMNEVDQAIYAEQKRVDDIARAVEKEIRLRDRALQYAREEVEERARLRRREHDDLVRSMQLQQQLKIEAMKVPSGLEDSVQRAAREAQVAQAEAAAEASRKRIAAQTEAAYVLINMERTQNLAILADRQRTNDELAAKMRASVSDQIATSRTLVDRIIADNKAVTIFLKNMLGTVVETFATAFRNILTGTMSWKDAMVGVFKSLQNALFNIFDTILKKWIENAAKMAATEKGFSIGKFFGGLFGAGSPFGKGVPQTTVSLPGGPMTVGAKPGIFQTSALAGGALIAGAGGLAGFGVGGMMGSRTTGALAGAGAGAATGATIGAFLGPVTAAMGAVIGGIAGAIGGMISGGKEGRMVEKARKEYLEAQGGIERIKKAANEAGVSIDKMLSTKKAKEFDAEIRKIENGIQVQKLIKGFAAANGGLDQLERKAKAAGVSLDAMLKPGQKAEDVARAIEEISKALELRKAKDSLDFTFSKMMDLKRAAQSVGYDLQRMYDAKTIEEFNGEQEYLNQLLAEQQVRMEGLAAAAQGLTKWAEGLEAALLKSVGGEAANNTKELIDEFMKAKAAGFGGTLTQYAQERPEEYDLNEEELQAATKAMDDYYQGLLRVGEVATTVFGRILRETGSIGQAMEAVGPILDKVKLALAATGSTASEGLQRLIQLRDAMTANADQVMILDGIAGAVRGLGDALGLTSQDANRMGAQLKDVYDTLINRGVAGNDALLLMQPSLQALYEAQHKFHLELDGTTQSLIDQAKQQGLVGDQFKSVSDKMLDVLLLIADVLGADIPDAYKKTRDALRDGEDATNDLGGAADDAAENFWDLKRAAEEAGRAAENAGTYGAEGHSPTGIKQLNFRLKEAIALQEQLRLSSIQLGQDIEKAATDAANPDDRAYSPYRRGPRYDQFVEQVEPPEGLPEDKALPLEITIQNEYTINAAALDPASAQNITDTVIIPSLISKAGTNTEQIAFELEKALAKVRGGRTT